MNTILLISEQYIKDNSAVYNSVDAKILRSHIFESQNINYRYIIPIELYDVIFEQFNDYRDYIAAGGTNPIEDEVDERILTLVNESKAMLLYYTLYNATFSLYSRITNKGINTQSSDYSEDIDFNVLEKMRIDWKHKAESYAQLLIEFLNANKDTYPEMKEECSTLEGSIFTNPLYLGDEI